jgi:hypothetical protein
MSIKRELLVHALDRLKHINFEDDHLTNDLIQTIQKYLAQPEQEPTTRHALDSYWNQEAYQRGYARAGLDLKREPITGKEISNGFNADDEATHPYSYWAGINFAEKHHGIGGGE